MRRDATSPATGDPACRTDAGCASATARRATAASSSSAATSACRKSRKRDSVKPICDSTPRSTTCRKACACTTRRTGSRSSTAASVEIFGLSRDMIAPARPTAKSSSSSVASGNHDGKTVPELLAEQAEFMSRLRNGTHYYELSNGRMVASVYSPTSDGGWVATYEDVTERRQAEAKIMHMARHDALTDLPNRVLFREKMEQALARGENLAVALSRSRSLQDRQRHAGSSGRRRAALRGDKASAGRCEDADTVARLGGDEFAIIQMRRAADRCERPRGRIIERSPSRSMSWRQQVVIGEPASASRSRRPTATSPTSCCATPTWRSIAPRATAAAPITSSSPTWTRRCRRVTLSSSTCARRLLTGEFELHYQPIVDLAAAKSAASKR